MSKAAPQNIIVFENLIEASETYVDKLGSVISYEMPEPFKIAEMSVAEARGRAFGERFKGMIQCTVPPSCKD